MSNTFDFKGSGLLDPPKPPENYVSTYHQPYISPTPGRFPLMAIGNSREPSIAEEEYLTKHYLTEIADLEMDADQMIQYPCLDPSLPTDRQPMMYSVDNCNATGIAQILRIWGLEYPVIPKKGNLEPPEFYDIKLKNVYKEESESGEMFLERWKNSIDLVWKYRSICACQLKDEPNTRDFKWLARAKDEILRIDKWNPLVFSNLLPINATAQQLTGDERGFVRPNITCTYDEYLKTYQDIVKPGVWCVDTYLLSNQPIGTKFNHNFFDTLTAIREVAINNDRPFWSTIRCLYGIQNKSDLLKDNYGLTAPMAKKLGTIMRLEVYSALALGAQGLMFWSMVSRSSMNQLWAPFMYPLTPSAKKRITELLEEDSESVDNQINEILSKRDNFDTSTLIMSRLYPELQNLISNIRKYESYFLNMVTDAIYVAGDKKINEIHLQNFNGVLGAITSIKTQGCVVASYLKGYPYETYVIINMDIEKSCDVELTFRQDHSLKDQMAEEDVSFGNSLKFTLQVGDWRILTTKEQTVLH